MKLEELEELLKSVTEVEPALTQFEPELKVELERIEELEAAEPETEALTTLDGDKGLTEFEVGDEVIE